MPSIPYPCGGRAIRVANPGKELPAYILLCNLPEGHEGPHYSIDTFGAFSWDQDDDGDVESA